MQCCSKVAAMKFQHLYVSKISTKFQSQTPPSHNVKHRIWSDRLEVESPLFEAIWAFLKNILFWLSYIQNTFYMLNCVIYIFGNDSRQFKIFDCEIWWKHVIVHMTKGHVHAVLSQAKVAFLSSPTYPLNPRPFYNDYTAAVMEIESD